MTVGPGIRFVDVSAESGLDFTHVSGSPEQRYILETMAGGGGFLDYDGDGYLDVFIVNSTREGEQPQGAFNRLYRNTQATAEDGQEARVFREVTQEAGLQRTGWGMGCAAGDYDNDGDVDLYITYWGPNVLYRNDGNGGFTEVTREAGVGDEGWGSSAAFGDVDGDGLLDLYVGNYLVFDLADPPNGGKPCTGFKGLEGFCGPMGLESQVDVLYRNEGGGLFADVSGSTGVDQHRYPALGVVFGDYDGDGDQDIYVANDSEPNLLWRNDGDWRLSEVAAFAGVAYSEEGRAQAGMGVDFGDYDNDGDLDLYVTNFSDDVNTLYQNQGDGSFVDATAAVGLGGVVRPYLGWSTALFDADNDGWLDLFVANGHLYPQLEKHPSGLRYPQRNLFYWNEGGVFGLAGAGSGLEVEKVSRGTAFGDYDNDGDVDLLVMNLNDTPSLLQNQGGNRNNWLGLDLVGDESNRDALGARVSVFAGGRKQIREVKRGYGYQSQHDGRVLFGLGREEEVERVEIHWPSGKAQVLERPPLRVYLKVGEGLREPVASYGTGEEKDSGVFPLGEARAPEPEPENYLATAGKADWSAEDYYEKGVELHEQGRYEEALPLLRAAIQQGPDYTAAYYSLAVTLYSGLGRSQEAAGLLEQVVARDSSWADIFALLGGIYMSLNQLERAIPMLDRAVVLDPGAWKSRNRLGVAHLRRGDTKRAVAAFQGAVQAAPYAPVPHLHLSRIYGRLGRDEAARREQAWFERLRPVQGQIDSYKAQLKETPADAELHYLLGRQYLKQGRQAEALSWFARAVELEPGYGLAHYGVGGMYHRQGNLEQAITAYERAYEADSSLVMALNDLGVAYRQAGRLQEAIEVYQKATRRRPGWARIQSNLGRAYAEQGKNQEAIRAYRKALELDSTLVQTRRDLEQLYKGLMGK